MELLHARLIRTNTCVNGCRCDYTICGDQDPYVKEQDVYKRQAFPLAHNLRFSFAVTFIIGDAF